MTENEVKTAVMKKLKSYEFSGDVLWYERLNSGMVQKHGNYIRLCQPGTPDIVAIVKKETWVVVLFLECKRSGKKTLDFEQEEFFTRMKKFDGVVCKLINDPAQLSGILKEIDNG